MLAAVSSAQLLFITLTRYAGGRVLVPIADIACISEVEDGSLVRLARARPVKVQEEIRFIHRKIREAHGRPG